MVGGCWRCGTLWPANAVGIWHWDLRFRLCHEQTTGESTRGTQIGTCFIWTLLLNGLLHFTLILMSFLLLFICLFLTEPNSPTTSKLTLVPEEKIPFISLINLHFSSFILGIMDGIFNILQDQSGGALLSSMFHTEEVVTLDWKIWTWIVIFVHMTVVCKYWCWFHECAGRLLSLPRRFLYFYGKERRHWACF